MEEGQDQTADAKYKVELNCFARRGMSFKEYSLTAHVTWVINEDETLEMAQPSPGLKSENNQRVHFFFYVRQEATYVFTILGQNTKKRSCSIGGGAAKKLFVLPIR